MKENVNLEENPSAIIGKKKEKQQMDGKVQDLLIEQLEKSKIKRHFEKITSLLGVTRSQYMAIQHFEKFYKSRKNHGIEQMDKNNDLVMVKQLFACWD